MSRDFALGRLPALAILGTCSRRLKVVVCKSSSSRYHHRLRCDHSPSTPTCSVSGMLHIGSTLCRCKLIFAVVLGYYH